MTEKNSPQDAAEQSQLGPDWSLALHGLSSGVVLAAVVAAGAHTLGLAPGPVTASVPLRPQMAALPPMPSAPLWQPVELHAEPAPPAVPESLLPAPVVPVQMALAHPRGGIGFMGPIAGPLNTDVGPMGPVLGPQWTRNPLPYIGQQVPVPSVPPKPGRQVSEASSELPDLRKLELSRLAHPDLQARGNQPAGAVKAVEISAQQPLSLSLSVARPAKGFQVGEAVAVRMTANADCNVALLRIDAAGKATTLFRSPGASRQFACVLRAGPSGGPEYLVALATVRPLDGTDAAAALRASGAGFNTVPAVAEGTAPSQAWTLAVSQAATLGGTPAHWERHEWAVATASFGTRPGTAVTKRPAVPAAGGSVKVAGNGPASNGPGGNGPATEGSQLPSTSRPAVKPGDASTARTKPEVAPASQPAEPAANPKAANAPKTDAQPAEGAEAPAS